MAELSTPFVSLGRVLIQARMKGVAERVPREQTLLLLGRLGGFGETPLVLPIVG